MDNHSICWNITHNCNRNCKYCFRDANEKDLPLEENIEVLHKLINLGVKKITWSGGEPTEYKGLIELLKIAKENNIYNKLVTNASNFGIDKVDDIIQYLDEITFSIDFVDDKLNEQFGRGKNYFSHIEGVIKYITLKYPNCVFSVNTIVMKQNLNLLDEIYDTISKFKLRRWKLIQFCSFRGTAAKSKDRFSITKEEYMEALNKCKKMQCDFEIKGHTAEEVENAHIIVTSAGVILEP